MRNVFNSIINLASHLYEICAPYLTFDIPGFDINIEAIHNATNTFRDALARADPSVSGTAGLVAVGMGAVASPYIVSVSLSLHLTKAPKMTLESL